MIFTSVEGLKVFLAATAAAAANCIIAFELMRLAYTADKKWFKENHHGRWQPDLLSPQSFFNNNREEPSGTAKEMPYKK